MNKNLIKLLSIACIAGLNRASGQLSKLSKDGLYLGPRSVTINTGVYGVNPVIHKPRRYLPKPALEIVKNFIKEQSIAARSWSDGFGTSSIEYSLYSNPVLTAEPFPGLKLLEVRCVGKRFTVSQKVDRWNMSGGLMAELVMGRNFLGYAEYRDAIRERFGLVSTVNGKNALLEVEKLGNEIKEGDQLGILNPKNLEELFEVKISIRYNPKRSSRDLLERSSSELISEALKAGIAALADSQGKKLVLRIIRARLGISLTDEELINMVSCHCETTYNNQEEALPFGMYTRQMITDGVPTQAKELVLLSVPTPYEGKTFNERFIFTLSEIELEKLLATLPSDHRLRKIVQRTLA